MNTCVAVIPARRAEATIRATLESLRLGNGDFVDRAIVVTSKDDPTAAVVRAWASRDPRVELVLADRPVTAGLARNLGRAAAGGAELLLFVDADCRLEPGGAGRLAIELERSGADAVAARILIDGDCANAVPGDAGAVAHVRHALEFKEAASARTPPAEWLPPSTTLLCRAYAFERAGGFPDLWPGEDLVFAWRLRELGGVAVRSRDVRAFHRHPGGARRMLRHQLRLGRTAAEARRMTAMHGHVFARSPGLALLLFPARLLRIARWQVGEGRAAALRTFFLLPLLVAGLAAWTLGFASASGAAPRRSEVGWRVRGAESPT